MGHAQGRIDKTIFVFGGYSCRKNAQALKGGPSCFMDTLFGFSIDQRTWFKVEPTGRSTRFRLLEFLFRLLALGEGLPLNDCGGHSTVGFRWQRDEFGRRLELLSRRRSI